MSGAVRRYLVLAAIVVVVLVLAFVFRDRITGSAADLQIGDCFDVPTVDIEIKDVQHHPCAEAHTGEVFAVLTHPAAAGAPVIDDATMSQYFGTTCLPILNAYIGEDATTQTVLDFGAFYPTNDGWNNGDRSVTCYLYRVDEGSMTASMKDARP